MREQRDTAAPMAQSGRELAQQAERVYSGAQRGLNGCAELKTHRETHRETHRARSTLGASGSAQPVLD